MSETSPEPDRPIVITAKGVELDDLDAALLDLDSPASIDMVAEHAWERVGRDGELLAAWMAELQHPDYTSANTADDQARALGRWKEVRQNLERLKYIAEVVGSVSLQEMFKDPRQG